MTEKKLEHLIAKAFSVGGTLKSQKFSEINTIGKSVLLVGMSKLFCDVFQRISSSHTIVVEIGKLVLLFDLKSLLH